MNQYIKRRPAQRTVLSFLLESSLTWRKNLMSCNKTVLGHCSVSHSYQTSWLQMGIFHQTQTQARRFFWLLQISSCRIGNHLENVIDYDETFAPVAKFPLFERFHDTLLLAHFIQCQYNRSLFFFLLDNLWVHYHVVSSFHTFLIRVLLLTMM